MSRLVETGPLACRRRFSSLAVDVRQFVSDFEFPSLSPSDGERAGARGRLFPFPSLFPFVSDFGFWIWDFIRSGPVVLVLMGFLAGTVMGGPQSQSASTVPEPNLSLSGKFTPPVSGATTNRAAARTAAALMEALKIEPVSSNRFRIGRVELDRQRRTVRIPARVKNRDLVVEYALVTEQGKAYESLLTTDASPTDIHLACLLLGAGQGTVEGAFRKAAPVPETNAVQIEVSWETNSQPVHFALSALICLTATPPESATPVMAVDKWLYNGSRFDAGGFAAQREGSIISLIRDAAALVNNPGEDRDNDMLHWPNARLLPAEGWPVQVLLRLPSPKK